MTTLKVLTIVTAIFAGETSLAMAQSFLPWEYVLAPGVLIARPGYGVPPGYAVVPPGYAVALAYFSPPGCNPSWYVGGHHRTCRCLCSHKIIHATNGY